MPPYPDSTDGSTIWTYLQSFNASTLPLNKVSGTFTIAATYCEPAKKFTKRKDTVQLLVHGLGSNRKYWDGLKFPHSAFPGQYSWTQYALSQGYSTLAIDNLGSGESARPDPIQTVQSSLQISLIHNIIQSLRSQKLSPILNRFKKVVLVTHSYSSVLGRALSIENPRDGPDAYILTATSTNLLGMGALSPVSAKVLYPNQFSNLHPAYASIPGSALRESSYALSGSFDPAILAWDEQHPYVFALGEIAIPARNLTSEFSGPVMILTGRRDALVCSPAGNITVEVPDCGVGETSNPALSVEKFLKARPWEVFVPEGTGHMVNLHYSAGKSFKAAHEFLEGASF
ncbi:hypothetical protein P154DRAFT_447027 [Amniculicola lignicola CBS 123094]|uniref:AB hydrolase-1 domain-containing protein n=1 Tax=Amniculicola lignicola CBS 123094 TaxID=1392246 RepID=A0A6A5W3M0_9PLEO|nr:hypothetical protein P154DRAFT_447027 [Amniculicola lignicola CBS 123094]